MNGAFKVDFSELDKFKEDLKITADDFDDFLKKFLTEMANRIIKLTKEKQSGNDERYRAYDTGTMTGAWEVSRIEGGGKDVYAVLHNSVEYATEIEYGHRIVRNGVEVGYYNGRFMLKTSTDYINRQLPLRYEKEFKKFCISRGLDVN